MPNSKLETLFVIPLNDRRKTFEDDDKLPSLPLPDLSHTLNRYMESVKPFLNEEEFQKTAKLVHSFKEGVGKKLHEMLMEKAERERNWLEKWWEDITYLKQRTPLLPYCSMDGVLPKNISHWTYGNEYDQVKHASAVGYYLVQYWTLLRRERLLPTLTSDNKSCFSMAQYKRLFNGSRIPGEKMDQLLCSFKTLPEGACSSNAIVMCKNRFFVIDTIDARGNPISLFDWEQLLKKIIRVTNESENAIGIGLLTCDERTNWYKNRRHLEYISKVNKHTLNIIDESMFLLILDDASPDTDTEVTQNNICGNYMNRWADKSMAIIVYQNGRIGSIFEHSAFDGIVAIGCHHYLLTALDEYKVEMDRKHSVGRVLKIDQISFDIDEYLRKEINRLILETDINRREITMTRNCFEDYGKQEIQRMRFHPDSFLQMCIQLAYISIHKIPAPCYETATTRKYYNGRTETVRTCTLECVEWAFAMLDGKATTEEKHMLFIRAIKKQDELMLAARDNSGCDRHLFGLSCMAAEQNIELPDLFFDPAFLKSGGSGNFILSTSCTGYTTLGGGVAPMCRNGYGVFYNISPNKIYITVSVNNNSQETDALKFFESVRQALRDIRLLIILPEQYGPKSKI